MSAIGKGEVRGASALSAAEARLGADAALWAAAGSPAAAEALRRAELVDPRAHEHLLGGRCGVGW